MVMQRYVAKIVFRQLKCEKPSIVQECEASIPADLHLVCRDSYRPGDFCTKADSF